MTKLFKALGDNQDKQWDSHYTNKVADIILDRMVWKIMSFTGGVNRSLLQKLYNNLNAYLSRHSKMYIIRFDVSMYDSLANNKKISKLRSVIIKQLKLHYNTSAGFGWVREQNTTEDKCHYHCFVILNGHEVNNSYKMFRLVMPVALKLITDLNFYFPENCGYMVKRHQLDTFQAALYRLSYLAKNHTKEGNPALAKGFYFSRIKHRALVSELS